jgi:nitrite reductase/ring-hydroxylating ferredoxin subunit/uncharacterized membrane protein
MFPALRVFVKKQHWLDTAGDPLQRSVNWIYGPGRGIRKTLQNFLNGVWLGHPLHPLLTDVPIGAWSVTVVLDTVALVTGKNTYRGPGEVALAVGLTAALGAAVTGTTDWKDTYGEERSLGLLHGLLMLAATLVFAVSLVIHLTGPWLIGVILGYVGVLVMTAGAYLGGDEVFEMGYGVNHTAFQHGPRKYVPVLTAAALKPATPTRVEADGTPVLLVGLDNQVYALYDTCMHAGCSLAGGKLDGTSIVCPCHGSQYDLRDGSVKNGPATMSQPYCDVRVEDGTIEVKARST